jgi:hypothetical protein
MVIKFLRFAVVIFISMLTFSCTEKYETIEGEPGIFILASSSSAIAGEEISFEVKKEDGEDVTEEADILINGETILGNSFSAEAVGFYEVYARYQNFSSSTVDIEYHDGSQINFKKRALIEDYTGTWCGWCPRVSYAMKLVVNQSDAVELVAIHRAPSGTQDPFNYEDAGPLEALINTAGYPKGFINRLNKWNTPEQDNTGQALDFTQGINPKLGLKMSSELQGNNLNLTVEVQFAKDFENSKLVVYVLENGLVYPQVNYTSFYGGFNPISDYEHNYTLRTTLTNILGDEVPTSETRTGSFYERNFNFEVPEIIEDVSQVDFVAFMVDEEGNVINVRKASLGEHQEFEIE